MIFSSCGRLVLGHTVLYRATIWATHSGRHVVSNSLEVYTVSSNFRNMFPGPTNLETCASKAKAFKCVSGVSDMFVSLKLHQECGYFNSSTLQRWSVNELLGGHDVDLFCSGSLGLSTAVLSV